MRGDDGDEKRASSERKPQPNAPKIKGKVSDADVEYIPDKKAKKATEKRTEVSYLYFTYPDIYLPAFSDNI